MNDTETPVRWQVLEFTRKGPLTRYNGCDFEYARTLYDGLEHGAFFELHGRAADGSVQPGQAATNLMLGRRAYGREELD